MPKENEIIWLDKEPFPELQTRDLLLRLSHALIHSHANNIPAWLLNNSFKNLSLQEAQIIVPCLKLTELYLKQISRDPFLSITSNRFWHIMRDSLYSDITVSLAGSDNLYKPVEYSTLLKSYYRSPPTIFSPPSQPPFRISKFIQLNDYQTLIHVVTEATAEQLSEENLYLSIIKQASAVPARLAHLFLNQITHTQPQPTP